MKEIFSKSLYGRVNLNMIRKYAGYCNFFIMMTLMLASFVQVQGQTFGGGSGTPSDPYQVATAEHLNNVRNYPSASFVQTANITFTTADFDIGGTYYNDGKGWRPIGTSTQRFTGVYNGKDKIISGLAMTRLDTISIGLFGFIGTGGVVKNLNVINATISGANYDYTQGSTNAGILAGESKGTIKNVVVTGSVTSASVCGGVVGINDTGGTLEQCSANCTVRGTSKAGGVAGINKGPVSLCQSAGSASVGVGSWGDVGGLFGESSGNVANCFSRASVSGDFAGGLMSYQTGGTIQKCYATGYVQFFVSGGSFASGGLIGYSVNNSVTNSFWDKNTTFMNTSDGGPGAVGKTTAEMKTKSTFTNAGWDFTSLWAMSADYNNNYPYLRSMFRFTSGSGTQADPYLISSKVLLNAVRYYSNAGAWFRQTQNITFDAADFASGGEYYNAGAGWNPIGDETKNFSGQYVGGGFKITGLTINRPAKDTIGLFGSLTNSTVSGLRLENVNIKGAQHTGSIAGRASNSALDTVSVTGSITATSNAGGLIGSASNSSFNLSCSRANISATGQNAGGLAGTLSASSVKNCYALGTVTAAAGNAGGLVGTVSSATIDTTYAAGVITVTSGVKGGLIAVNTSGTTNNSYWDSEVSTAPASAGGTPQTTAQMKEKSTFTGWDFQTVWGMDITLDTTINKGYPYLQAFEGAPPVFAGGHGTPDNPYLISNLTQLNLIRYFSGSHFLQICDLHFSSSDFLPGGAFYNDGKGWIPVGNDTNAFVCGYNGGGNKITGLFINRPGESYIGLFGNILNTTISNLSLKEVSIKGGEYTGGITGKMSASSISVVSVSGQVTGDAKVGGLAGVTSGVGTISECFTDGIITATTLVGGIAGICYGPDNWIKDCYVAGKVSATIPGQGRAGGIVEYLSVGNIKNCHVYAEIKGGDRFTTGGICESSLQGLVENALWDTIATGTGYSYFGTGESTVKMKMISTFVDVGWDTVSVWGMNPTINNGYPYLKAHHPFPAGDGSAQNPYQVSNKTELDMVRNFPYAHFIQIADITFAAEDFAYGGTYHRDGGKWRPISDQKFASFKGKYNGNGKTISGIECWNYYDGVGGVFGYIGKSGEISALTLTNMSISGRTYAGILAGSSEGKITGVQVSGTLYDADYIGGLVAYSGTEATISQSAANCGATTPYGIGGLVALNHGKITESLAKINVWGYPNSSSGLVEWNFGQIDNSFSYLSGNTILGSGFNCHNVTGATIKHCYSAGKFTFTGQGAGFNMFDDGGTLINSFWDVDTSGINYGWGIGKTTAEMKTRSTFTSAGWDFRAESANGTNNYWSIHDTANNGYPYLIWQYLNLPEMMGISVTLADSVFCSGEADSLLVSVLGEFADTNTFTAQLSDSAGAFTTPVNIGTLQSDTSGYLHFIIPSGSKYGTDYRVRVVSNTPEYTGDDNGKNLTIFTDFNPGAISATSDTICHGATPGTISSTQAANGGNRTYIYQWQVSISRSDSGFSNISGATAASYAPSTGLTTTSWFRRLAKDGACDTAFVASTGVKKIIVRPSFKAGAIATTGDTICSGGNPVLIGNDTLASGGNNLISYIWQQMTSSDYTTVAGATASSYDPPVLTQTTTYRRLAKDGLCQASYALSGGTWKVFVRPAFSAGAIRTTGDTICIGSDPDPIASDTLASGGDNRIAYQWQSSTTSASAGFTNISGATATGYDPDSLTTTTWYRRLAKDGACQATFAASSGTWKVLVNPLTVAGSVTGGTIVCYGTNSTDLELAGHTGSVVTWQSSTDGASWNDIPGSTTTNYTAVDLTTSTWYRTIVQSGVCASAVSDSTKLTINDNLTISGYARYNNNPLTPLNGLKVMLRQGTTLIASSATSSNGYYSFTGLETGTYNISVISDHPSGNWQTWGGVNMTDYLLAYKHATTGPPLPANPPVVRISGDVKAPQSPPVINTIDASAIQMAAKYGWGNPAYFQIPKWVFSGVTARLDSIPLGCTNIVFDLRGLCSGDLNGTFIPANGFKMAEPGLALVNRGVMPVREEMTFPVGVSETATIGALTLMLNYDPAQIEITGVEMPENAGTQPWFMAENGILSIGWASLEPVVARAGQPVLMIRARLKGATTPIRFMLNENPDSEIADGDGNVIGGVKLSIPDAGHAVPTASGVLTIYPNPARDVINVEFSMESDGFARVELTTLQGVTIHSSGNIFAETGMNKVTMNISDLANGIYLTKVTRNGQVQIQKLVVNK